MKTKIWTLAGVVAFATIAYLIAKRLAKPAVEQYSNDLRKENERHHLTNVFSKAKQVAIGS